MYNFIISTDSTADLPKEYIEENEIAIHPLNYIVGGVEYGVNEQQMAPSVFYKGMREGTMPTTCASNPAYITKMMKKQVEGSFDVLHLSFSSALSSSYNNAVICANQVMEEVKGSKIIVVDTLCATVGQALIVTHAVELRKQGYTIEEVADWLNNNKEHIAHYFIVDDLHHLVRGGRLNKSAAIIGTALQIQPLLHVNEEGALENIGKIRGRKKALKALAAGIGDNIEGLEMKRVFLSHSDCYEDACFVADQIKELYKVEDIYITDMTPTIGAHTGAGTVVVSYFGNKR